QTPDQGRNRLPSESFELLQGLQTFRTTQAADVVEHEAVDDLVQLVLFCESQSRQARRESAGLARRVLLRARRSSQCQRQRQEIVQYHVSSSLLETNAPAIPLPYLTVGCSFSQSPKG